MAFGGFAHIGGRVHGFCELKPEARRYRVTLHKTALRMMREQLAKSRFIYAAPQTDIAEAEAWLVRLGFRRLEEVPDNLWRAG